MSRATEKQKSFIRAINKKLGISDKENNVIVNSINTFDEADKYIKTYLPIAKIKNMELDEIRRIYNKLIQGVEKFFEGEKDV